MDLLAKIQRYDRAQDRAQEAQFDLAAARDCASSAAEAEADAACLLREDLAWNGPAIVLEADGSKTVYCAAEPGGPILVATGRVVRRAEPRDTAEDLVDPRLREAANGVHVGPVS